MRVSSPVPHKKARIEIIPLIDIMFFLLASFMMVSLSQVHMKGIKVNLPTGSSGETQSKRDYISVSVDKDGHYFFDSFMMVSLSQVHMKGIKVNLPTGSSGETQSKRDYISVSVDKDGHYFFDKNEMTEADMQARLIQVHQSDPEAKVFVRGDRDTVHGNIVHLLDMLRSAGFYKISFEIKSEALKGVPGPGA